LPRNDDLQPRVHLSYVFVAWPRRPCDEGPSWTLDPVFKEPSTRVGLTIVGPPRAPVKPLFGSSGGSYSVVWGRPPRRPRERKDTEGGGACQPLSAVSFALFRHQAPKSAAKVRTRWRWEIAWVRVAAATPPRRVRLTTGAGPSLATGLGVTSS
jgi:hypothetical protein